MKKNRVPQSVVAIAVIFSLINLIASQALQVKGVLTELDERARMLFAEKSALTNFQHVVNGHQYQYILDYQSGLSVTFTLAEKTIFVTKNKFQLPLFPDKSENQSQLVITKYLIDINQINRDYVLRFFTVLSDGYLIQFQWQQTLFTFQLNLNLQIRRKQSKQITSNNPKSIDSIFLAPLNTQKSAVIENNDSSITQAILQSPISQPRSLIATNSPVLDQETIDGITQFFNTNGSINLISSAKIQNITKIGDTNRYLIQMIIPVKQRQIIYQMIIRNDTNGYEILGGTYYIDFIPSYSQVINRNQTLTQWMDQIIRTKLARIMPEEVQLVNIWEDEPYYKLNYTITDADYQVQFIFDSILKKVNITNIVVTQDIIETGTSIAQNSNLNSDTFLSSGDGTPQLYAAPINVATSILTPVTTSDSMIPTNSNKPSGFQIYLTQEDCSNQPYNVVRVTHRYRKRNPSNTSLPSNSTPSSASTKNILSTASPTEPISFGEIQLPQTTTQSTSNQILGNTSSIPNDLASQPSAALDTANYNIENVIISPADTTPTLALEDILGPSNQLSAPSPTNSSIYETFNASLLPSNLQVISQLVPYTKQQIVSVLTFLQETITTVSFKGAQIYLIQKFDYGFRIVFLIDSQYMQFFIIKTLTSSFKVISMHNVTQEQANSVNYFSQFFVVDLDDDLQVLFMKIIPQSKIGLVTSITNIQLRIQADGYYYQIVIGTESGNSYLIALYYKPEQNYSQILSYQQISSQYYMTEAALAKITEQRIDLTVKQQWDLNLLNVLDFVNGKFGQKFSSFDVVYVYKIVLTTLNAVRYRIGFESESGIYFEVIVIYVSSLSTPIVQKYVKLYDGYGLISQSSLDAKSVISVYQFALQEQIRQIAISEYSVENIVMKEIPQFGKLYKLVLNNTFYFAVTIFVDLQGTMTIYGIDGRPSYYATLIGLSYTSFGYLATIIQNMRNYLTSITSPPVTTQPTTPSTSTQQTLSSISPTFPTLKFNFSSTITPNASSYNAKMDLFCLKSNGTICLSCYYRYYPLNGKCVAVPIPCSTYNNVTGQCLSCYTGYYLSTNGNCTQINLLCFQTDSNGKCTQCFNDYTLLNNQCYNSKGMVSANLSNLSISQCDPLCEQYQNKVCSKCVYGAYMSAKYKSCTVEDPNALQFDTVHEVAIQCVRGYTISQEGICIRTI